MNKIKIFIIIIIIGSSLYAKAPVMENFVPTEWKIMNELSENETKSFIEKYDQILFLLIFYQP